MGVVFTAPGALVADVMPWEERGLAMGLYNSCIYLGMMASSATMGSLPAGGEINRTITLHHINPGSFPREPHRDLATLNHELFKAGHLARQNLAIG